MKKNLFFLAVAAVALASCSNDEVVSQNTTTNQPQEIAFSPVNQAATRAASATTPAVESAVYPDELTMQVAAYAFPPASTTWTGGVYFAKTAFDGTNAANWKASPAKYWPLTDAYLSFLAVAGVEASDITMTNANAASVVYDSDSFTAQTDLMYSAAQEHVIQTGNALTYPDDVDMTFNHALALLKFNARVPSGAGYNTQIHLDKIVIVNGYKTGTLALGYTNYNAVGTPSLTHTWTPDAASNIDVPGSDAYSATAYASDASKKLKNDGTYSECGAALVVPKNAASFTKFTIYYTLDGKQYTFDYTPASTVLNQATKYVYNITFTLTEIEIDPVVEPWTDGGTTLIDIPSFAYAADGTQVVNVPNKAGTYVFTVSGVPAATYTVSEDTSTGDDIVTAQSITAPAGGTLAAEGSLTISVTVTENASGTKTRGVKLNNGSSDVMTFTITQTAS